MKPIHVPPMIARKSAVEGLCQWFALCNNDATTTRDHPVLGKVPICSRCDAKVRVLSS